MRRNAVLEGDLDEGLRLSARARPPTNIDDYTLLYDTLGGFVDEAAKKPEPTEVPPGPRSWLGLPSSAHAQNAPESRSVTGRPGATQGDEEHIRDFFARYQAALESEDVEVIAALHVELTEAQRHALGQYFETASELRVRIFKIDVAVEGEQALATFTREDRFTDVRNGREVHLEVRLSSLMAKEDGVWKIRGLKKPS